MVERLRKLHRENATIGVERAFLPADAEEVLRSELPSARIVDATVALERLRARKTPRGTQLPSPRLRTRGRFDARDHRRSRSGHHQARDGRGTPPRGSVARPHLRVLPDHRRHQPQPRAVRPGLARGRSDVDRLRRQLQGLYRRPLPDGRAGRAGRRASGSPRRDRGHPAGGAEADPGRRPRRRHLRLGRRGAPALRPTATSSISSPTAWASSRTRRRA